MADAVDDNDRTKKHESKNRPRNQNQESSITGQSFQKSQQVFY